MAGDRKIQERAVFIEGDAGTGPAALEVLHRYGRLGIIVEPGPPESGNGEAALDEAFGSLTWAESIGLAALRLRQSSTYRDVKANRPRDGEVWDMQQCMTTPPPRDSSSGIALAQQQLHLEGPVAVGIVVVQGPTADLICSEAEILNIVAEVQNGLSFYPEANPYSGITFSYDVQIVNILAQPDPNATGAALERVWLPPAMGELGFTAAQIGVSEYVADLRYRLGAPQAYCAFFTKYPLYHFAYADFGGPHLVVAADGGNVWGASNIDSVFAHETGHIFGCPDEYLGNQDSTCHDSADCSVKWGPFDIVNGNCQVCEPDGGEPCIMKSNSFTVCSFTPAHLGWTPRLVLRNFGYLPEAGGWRFDRHLRFLVDLTGDGRADIVGFGDHGVSVARASRVSGGFESARLVLNEFGYVAGHWRVDRHPRFLADLTGDGRADIVGFGDDGVWTALNNGDGSFRSGKFVLSEFGTAQGWRVDRHPRFLADLTGSGRADIVGFDDRGVVTALSNGDGSFQLLGRVLDGFAYSDSWRVDRHPRFLADLTGDGRADIVGFGDDGVWTALSNGDGSFRSGKFVLSEFGTAQGWRVDRHPRLLAGLTGSGRADIVGFGDSGVITALSNGDGSFRLFGRVLQGFGYNAGWRVDRHPRYVADITGDLIPDIVGIGDSGVWVSRARLDGYDTPRKVTPHYGGNGWTERNPRYLADITGDHRKDVVGFADGGVSVRRF